MGFAAARLNPSYDAGTRAGGNAISTNVPVLRALLIAKEAPFASASALVSGRPRPAAPEPQRVDVASWRSFAVKIIGVLVAANLLGVAIYVAGRAKRT